MKISLSPLFPLSPPLPSDDVTGVIKTQLSFVFDLQTSFFFMSKWNWLDFEESLWKRRCDQWPGLQIFLAPKFMLWCNKLLCLTPVNISGLELSFRVSLGEPLKVSYFILLVSQIYSKGLFLVGNVRRSQTPRRITKKRKLWRKNIL